MPAASSPGVTRHHCEALLSYVESLWLYFVLVSGIIIVPGMGMMFVMANGLTTGRRAGLLATSGLMLGGAAHTVIGSLLVAGLSTLIPRSRLR